MALFGKKIPALIDPDAEHAALATAAGDSTAVAALDRTDPLGDVPELAQAELLRDGDGGRVEVVRLGAGEDADSFLRLTVDDAKRAATIRELILELPES